MKKTLLFSSALLLLAFNQPPGKKITHPRTNSFITGKKVNVYTTADKSNLRLTLTHSSLQFADFGQLKETQPCVFVDPTKTFQTMVGIAGALTDATAETFSKLPVEKQQELLQAFYSPQNSFSADQNQC